jgi:hypothetical protein
MGAMIAGRSTCKWILNWKTTRELPLVDGVILAPQRMPEHVSMHIHTNLASKSFFKRSYPCGIGPGLGSTIHMGEFRKRRRSVHGTNEAGWRR